MEYYYKKKKNTMHTCTPRTLHTKYVDIFLFEFWNNELQSVVDTIIHVYY